MTIGCNYCGRAIPDAEPHVCTPEDDLAAAGDDLRDVIERDLIVTNPNDPDWRPDPKDLA